MIFWSAQRQATSERSPNPKVLSEGGPSLDCEALSEGILVFRC